MSGLLQPQLIPMEKSQGTSFFVLTHPIFLPAKKLDTVLHLCSILFTPQRTRGQPKHRLCVVSTGASWRHCSEESLAHPGHKRIFFMGLASCRTWLLPPALSFLPPLLPGSEQKQAQGENALESKIKKYRGQKADSLTSDKGKPRNLAEISKPPLQEGRKNQLEQACHHPRSWCQKALLGLADYWAIKAWRGDLLPSAAWTAASLKGNWDFSFALPHLLRRLPELQLRCDSQAHRGQKSQTCAMELDQAGVLLLAMNFQLFLK